MAVTYFTIESSTKKWDVSELVTDIDWETDTGFSAGSLTFKLLEVNEGFTPHNGDKVEFKWDGRKIFKGRIFKTDYSSDEVFSVTAYDNLRYLKNQDMIVWGVGGIGGRFEKIMSSIGGIPYDTNSQSRIKLAEEIQDGQTYFDRLAEWAKEIKRREGLRVFLRDVYGKVELVALEVTWREFLVLSDRSLTTGWTYSQSADDMANTIKLVRETQDKKKRSIYTTKVASNSSSMKKFGPLQIVEKADDKLNDAQMQAKVNQILRDKNTQKQTFSISTIGTMDASGGLGMRAGERFYLDIDSLRDIGIGMRRMFATRVKHHFGPDWTMDIDMEFD